ncbi:MAG: replicative DNA helicase [Lachnospiraceae bacterium]|nr:replicative DNA helicase [Lachnospiraceae bacterium]
MDEKLIKRVMPHDENAEKVLIGAMIMDADAIAVAMEAVGGSDFYDKKLGTFFDVMVEMYQDGVTVDVITLEERLKKKDIPEEYTSISYLGSLVAMAPTTASNLIRQYAGIIRDKSLMRQFIRAAEDQIQQCYLDKTDRESLFANAEKQLFEVFRNGTRAKDTVAIKDVVLEALQNIEVASKSQGAVTGIPTGFAKLDYMTAGMQPSDLVLIAARPSMGKTAFALNIAEYMAIRNNYTTAIFSLEMSRTQLMNRFLSMHSRIESSKLRTGRLDSNEWSSLMETSRVISASSLLIEDKPGITIPEFRSKCMKFKLENNLKCVIVDYLQLMNSGRDISNKVQEVAEISKSLKSIAREIECPIIALSQLSRDVEKRDDKRPMLSDLRESGAIEQDADVVMFIYRDDYYHKDSKDVGKSEIIIGKQRQGPIGTVKLGWIPDQTRFVNLQKEDE